MKMCFRYVGAEQQHRIDAQTDREFTLLFQRAALLGLKSSGVLTEQQHRIAEEALLAQYRSASVTSCFEAKTDD